MNAALDTVRQIFVAGGLVMWPLALLSVVSVMLTLERAWFWARTHGAGARRHAGVVASAVRAGEVEQAERLAREDASVYGRFAAAVLRAGREEGIGSGASAAHAGAAAEAIEKLRPAIERSGTAMATIIAAAPLLGILGTVTGIIKSFRLLGASEVVTDPALVAGGIGEALYTTAFGLIVALVTLFPHAVFRAQAERCIARLEAMAVSLTSGPPRDPGPRG
jgi:biopolymer transport protein ExbB